MEIDDGIKEKHSGMYCDDGHDRRPMASNIRSAGDMLTMMVTMTIKNPRMSDRDGNDTKGPIIVRLRVGTGSRDEDDKQRKATASIKSITTKP